MSIDLLNMIPEDWATLLDDDAKQRIIPSLNTFLNHECRQHTVYPPQELWFAALNHLNPAQVRVVIIGQDPYHGKGQGNGLAFSVNPDVKIPPSLRNIYLELFHDLGIKPAKNGDLTDWVSQGVLLLNTVLTVREAQAHSHKDQGFEQITSQFIHALGSQQRPIAFILWGAHARKFKTKIAHWHLVIESAHPSPLSAHNGFFGSKPFGQVNRWLLTQRQQPINWKISASSMTTQEYII